MPVVHNEALRPLARRADAGDDLARIAEVFDARRTLDLVSLPNGLYPAVPPGAPSAARYGAVWVRDNAMVANALRETGRTAEASRTMRALLGYFGRHVARFDRIVDGLADPADPMARPHIRFDGATLDELPETWAHAQNDALGYTLFQAARLAREGGYDLHPDDVAVLSRFPAYFEAIQYWQDADSGHWEEARKIEASSIGAVVAGLLEMAALLREDREKCAVFARASQKYAVTVEAIEGLVEKGRAALDARLPDESPPARGADAALLFLVYPLDVVTRAQADAILANVLSNLEGEDGIKRYAGDSYWCAGYERLFSVEERTGDFSGNMAARDRLLAPGTEAQWCIFDPVVSVAYAKRWLAERRPEDLGAAVRHFNRALGQVTAEGFTVDG